MILREPKFSDCEFIAECYSDWPESQRGRVFPVDVRNWIIRFRKTATIEQGLVGEVDGSPVGFVQFGQKFFGAKVYELVIHPDHRGKKYASTMWRLLKDKLVSEGVVACEFDALPGLMSDLTLNGRFKKVGEGVGLHTGLPLVKGQVTADMEI